MAKAIEFNGYTIESYYDRYTRSYVIISKDANGDQTREAQYVGRKSDVASAIEFEKYCLANGETPYLD